MTSPAGQDSRRGPGRSAGFSLLELVVVVFIIGILATMYTLSFGLMGSDPELDKEVDRLQSVLIFARESALTNGSELGVHFYPHGYEFAVFEEDFVEYRDAEDDQPDQSAWTVMQAGGLLGPRTIPDDIVIELEIDGQDVKLTEKKSVAVTGEDDETGENERYSPQVWLYSTGDMQPFVIRFRREFENEGLTLKFADDGTVERSAS